MTRLPFGRLGLAIGLALALCYTTTDLGLSAPNERSRLYLTVALFEQHSYVIDQARAHFGPVLDEAVSRGHYFTDKAPGASLLGLVPYAVTRLFVDARDVSVGMLLHIGRYGVMVPMGIAAFFALEALCLELGIGRAVARWSALAYLLATPAFHYSAAFFGHQIVAASLVTALWLIARQSRLGSKSAYTHLGVAGLLTGIAGITEYQALIGVLALTAYAFSASRGRRLRSMVAFLLGGLPLAAWLAQYHASCFGGPFELSYHHLSHPILAEVHRQGLGGVWRPTLQGLNGALFSLHRGVVATSPFVLLAPFGVLGLWRRGHAALAWILGALVLFYIGFVAASATWDAGWGYGPRLLIPVLPVLSLFVAEALERARGSRIVWGLAGSALLVSVVSFQTVTALFAEPPNELLNPWLDVVLPLASRSLFAPNLGSAWLGLQGWYGILPLLLVLGWLLAFALDATRRSARSRAWLGWLPVFPVLWLLAILGQGPSGSAQERTEFSAFARSLRVAPASPAPRD